jgi:cyclohexadienyl dehydratase
LVATFSRPYLLAGAVVLVADAQRFSSLESVNQSAVRLVVNAGGHLEKVARLRFPAVSLLTTPQNMTLPDFNVKGQADALLTESLEAPHFLDAHPQLRALPPIGRDRKAYLLKREDQELHEWLDAWLIKREADGFLTQIRTRWLGKEGGQTPFPPLAALFALMDVRLAVMPAVAAYKCDQQLPIEDLQQEARVLEKIAALATEKALDPAALQDLFRVQIDMAKQVQRGVLQGQQAIPAWAQGRDLRQELRPTLNQLSTRIVQELARVAPLIRNRAEIFTTAQQEMTNDTVTQEATLRLAQAIWKVKKREGANEP